MAYLKDKTKVFPLAHTTLYAKGWYHRTDNIFEDLKRCLELDDYTPFSESDVVGILLSRYDEYLSVKLLNFISDIEETNCWVYGYYLKEGDVYNRNEAIVRKVLSDLYTLKKDEWLFAVPNYGKGLKKPKHTSVQHIVSMFNNNQRYRQYCELITDNKGHAKFDINDDKIGLWVGENKNEFIVV